MPVLFVVKEQHSVLSWQVPLMTYNNVEYHNVSRTLCRVDDMSELAGLAHVEYHNVSRTLCRVDDMSELAVYTGITVEVSTLSSIPINFTLQAQLISFDLLLNKQRHVTIAASQPVYLRFTFANVSAVVVNVMSPDDVCLLFSVQEVKCPVADLVTDVNHLRGMYQTVSRNGSITVERSHFAGDAFFVVLTVLPSDYNCKRMAVINQPGVWTNGFYCLFRKTWAKWGERNCPSFEMAEVESNHVLSIDRRVL
ncbi:hypothetical protein LSAT2_013965 [Lamellibrachia satsuma]|nr:hypothetical protein LSAT2_013965 [Lamellibrachia satsuma]